MAHRAVRGELWRALLEHPLVRRTVFRPSTACFVHTGDNNATHRCRGLTRVLRDAFPVPVVDSACDTCQRTRRTRATACSRMTPMRHGRHVDSQLAKLVALGRREFERKTRAIDPCVRRIIGVLDAREWDAVATQVSFYSPRMRLATALDLLCTDRATRSEMHLLEIKATARTYNDDHCYRRRRGMCVGDGLERLPLSYYAQHQLQLWTMYAVMRDEIGVEPTSAVVVRANPRSARVYRLNEWIGRHEEAVRRRLAVFRATGRKRRR